MLFRHAGIASGSLGRFTGLVVPRQCCCRAKRGRPRRTEDTAEFDEFQQPVETAIRGAPRRRGRPGKTDVQADEPLATSQQGLERSSQEPHHPERLISLEDMTTSVALDSTDDTSMEGMFSYTHQAQGHDSNDMPPLDTYASQLTGPGLVKEEADVEQLERQLEEEQRLAGSRLPGAFRTAAESASRAAAAGAEEGAGAAAKARGIGARMLIPQAQPSEEEQQLSEEEMLLAKDEPPGVFDYEAGLTMANTIIEPEQLMSHMPKEWRPRSRQEADYRLRWATWVGTLERQRVQQEYEDDARRYLSAQNKESENIYLTAKAMSIVTAEIELEDHETGNRWDNFYPVWARAEHRWYPTGRFHAYNQYVKDNIGQLTMKYAPGADQEEDFELLEDVFLMADDPSIPGGALDDGTAGPASSLDLDSFITGMLPGTASSELGQAYLEDVLAPNEEELEEELE